MKQRDYIEVVNAYQKAQALRSWAEKEWRLVELQGPKEEDYDAASKVAAGLGRHRWKKRPHPVYTAAKERHDRNHYQELVTLENRLKEFSLELKDLEGKQTGNLTLAKTSFRRINELAAKAEQEKQLNAQASISAILTEMDEAVAFAVESLTESEPAQAPVNAPALVPQAAISGMVPQNLKRTGEVSQQAEGQAAQVAQAGQLAQPAGPSKTLILGGIGAILLGVGIFVAVRKRNN